MNTSRLNHPPRPDNFASWRPVITSKLVIKRFFSLAIVTLLVLFSGTPSAGAIENEGGDDQATVDPKDLKNPVPYTKKNVIRGKNVYLRYCQECHDRDGRSINNIEEEATDLTRPRIWSYGTSAGEVFTTLKKGGGDVMPPFESQLKDEDIWCLVNFLKSIGPKDQRPAYEDEEKETAEKK